MKIKELQKTVNIAWSPLPQHPIYLAAGTAAQQFDSNGNSTLEIYSTNFVEANLDLKLKSSLPSQYRFQKLIWSPTSFDATHPNGLIVGGCESGHVMIYSASKMLAHEEGLIARQDKHTGAVSGLDFNPFQTNLLASSASESEIFIWDLNNTTTHMNPGTKTQPLEDVQSVAWNRQVQHILASVFSTRCVIWDLRKSEQIIKLSDTQSRVRWHAIQWHPEVATQVWLASEDDQAPVVQMWDLRYATAPAKTMQIHTRGVLGMSWCPRDTDMVVSCGKDNRIYCWDPNTEVPEGNILSEVATTATWYSDVQWCPRNPALIASSSLDGNVSIYSLFGGTQEQAQTVNKIADSFPGMDQFAQTVHPQQSTKIVYEDLKIAPKWIKRPCAVTFGFGGKLVSFNAKSKSVNISQVVTEPQLVERANTLERSLTDTNFIDYCRQRADQMPDSHGRYLWYFIKANFELNPKEEMLNLLGYNKEDIERKFAKYIKEDDQTTNDLDQLTNRISNLTHSDSSEVDCDQTDGSTDLSQPVENNDAIFDGIAAAQKQQLNNGDQDDLTTATKPQFKIPSGEHADSLITEALLTGNLEAAVELCIESDRCTDALIIASTAGIEFLTKIQSRLLKQQQQSELSFVISALVTRDWLDFINHCTIESWKEALVAALKHGDRKIADICERLGDRLLAERPANVEYTRNAMLCYICAGNIDKIVTAWYHLKQVEQQSDTYKLKTVELQELAELVMLMSKSLGQQGVAIDFTGLFSEFILDYGLLLASQGALNAALDYIMALGFSSEPNPTVEELRERIYYAVTQKRPAQQQNQNAFGRQQQPQTQLPPQIQPRGSFSYQPPQQPAMTGFPNYPAPGNQYQTNSWNSIPTAPPSVPTIFNPAQAAPNVPTQAAKEALAQPPRPSSTSSSQGGSMNVGSSGGIHSRPKHVLDPSVAQSGTMLNNYGAPAAGSMQYNSTSNATDMANYGLPPVASVPGAPNAYNTNPFQSNPMPGAYTPSPYSGGGGVGVGVGSVSNTNINNYIPGVPPIETALPGQNVPQPLPQLQNIQRNPTPPSGWNDPPALNPTRIAKKTDASSVAAPITHPIYGVDPNQNQNQNTYMDPNAYQNTGMSGMPPPPPPIGTTNMLNPASGGGAGYSQMAYSNNNNPQQQQQQQAIPQHQQQQQNFQSQFNFQTTAIPSATQQHQQQQQQAWNTHANQTISYTEHAAPVQQRRAQPDPPKEKPPLPEEFIYLQTVLEELKNQCLNAATDARTKRKFVDVNKRLENLYDCLRESKLTPATTSALSQIVQFIQLGDYGNAIQTHTQIAFGSDFSQCAGFMPGLKVLIQSAADLQVYLQ